MGATSTTPANLVIGAPGVVLLGSTDVGAVIGTVTYRVVQNLFTPKINGLPGPLAQTDFVQSEMGQMELAIPEASSAVLAQQVPGSGNASIGNGVQGSPTYTASTLAAAAVAGQRTAIKLVSVTALAVGMYLGFAGSSPAIQIRQVTRVGTAGAGGTGIDIGDPLSANVASGAAATQYAGDGATTYSSGVMSNRRLGSGSYNTVEARLWGLAGLRYVFGLLQAVNLGPAEFALQDAAEMAPKVKFESRVDPSALTTSPWYIRQIPADA